MQILHKTQKFTSLCYYSARVIFLQIKPFNIVCIANENFPLVSIMKFYKKIHLKWSTALLLKDKVQDTTKSEIKRRMKILLVLFWGLFNNYQRIQPPTPPPPPPIPCLVMFRTIKIYAKNVKTFVYESKLMAFFSHLRFHHVIPLSTSSTF